MSIIEKLISKKSSANSVSALAQYERDLDTAIGSALARGVSIHMVIQTLETRENSARHRLAAGLKF